MLAPEEPTLKTDKPLVWLLHGKSHVLKCAFQAGNAADMKGKTIHNACGVSADWGDPIERGLRKAAAKRRRLWRWLVIDEISMVNARLLAQVEQYLRSAVPDAAAWKMDPLRKTSKPFAGILQLPPPTAADLANVPTSRRP